MFLNHLNSFRGRNLVPLSIFFDNGKQNFITLRQRNYKSKFFPYLSIAKTFRFLNVFVIFAKDTLCPWKGMATELKGEGQRNKPGFLTVVLTA
jgi:hypothetical protein